MIPEKVPHPRGNNSSTQSLPQAHRSFLTPSRILINIWPDLPGHQAQPEVTSRQCKLEDRRAPHHTHRTTVASPKPTGLCLNLSPIPISICCDRQLSNKLYVESDEPPATLMSLSEVRSLQIAFWGQRAKEGFQPGPFLRQVSAFPPFQLSIDLRGCWG